MAQDKYLVTGGAGFIGSNIVAELLKRGEDVAVFDNFSTGRMLNLEPFKKNIELIEADLRDAEAVRKSVKGRTFVLHQGALPSVTRSVEDPLSANEVNITGTLNILLAARDAEVKRVVAASSSSVYGDSEVMPKVETMPVLPMSPYAVTKLATEKYLAAFHKAYGLETVALRYFNIFGPRQDPTSQYSAVIPRFITALQRNEAPTVYGDGGQSRDFAYVENAVEANLLACKANNVAGEFYNVACGERFSLLELLDLLCHIMGKKIKPNHEPARAGDVRHSLADISKIKQAMHYETRVDLREGLEKTVEFFTRGIA
jgi:UDP-glucose 4-epimerase